MMLGLIVVFCMVLLLAAACTKKDNSDSESGTGDTVDAVTFPLKDEIEVTFTIGEHPTNGKYDWAEAGAPGFIWLKEQTNVKLVVDHIPQGSIKDRMNLMLSTNDLPDILFPQGTGWTLNDIETAGDAGIFINILDPKYAALIPNYLKLVESTPNLKAMTTTGKLYGFYQVDPHAAAFTGQLPYRKDLFDKFNLKPETWDELYEALKVLKAEFPDSYPFGTANQGDITSILRYGPAGFRSGNSVYYNFDKNAWVYGAQEDNYKLFLEFFAKLYKEKLLNPEFATMTYEQWTQSFVNNETFFSYWWSATGMWFPVFPSDPNYGRDKAWLEAHPVPSLVKGGPRGWVRNDAPSNVYDPKLISAKSEHIPEILALMDFVSDNDNVTQMAYGPKGVEWDIVDGKYRWINKEVKVAYNPEGTKSYRDVYKEKYGINMVSENNFSNNNDAWTSQQLNDAAADPDYTQFLDETAMYVEHGSTILEPQPIMRLGAEDSETLAQLKGAIDTYANEVTIKIINGSLPISEFDVMKKKIDELGIADLLALYKKGSGK